MLRRTMRAAIVLSVCLTCAACRSAATGAVSDGPAARPVIVQGAMDIEVRQLVAALQNVQEEHIQGWTFWRGNLDGHPVVVSKTMKGMSNAAAATAIGAGRYQPAAIINQGTAGGHDPSLHVYDIVLGAHSVNLGSFKTGTRGRGQGTDVGEWSPLDLNRTEGSAGMDPKALVMRQFPGDERLLAAARQAGPSYEKGRVIEGVIGSSDVWNSELDRIQRFHETFGTSVEEMETASAAQIAGMSGVPFLGIRVLSNNITNGSTYDRATGEACQRFVLDVLRNYVRTLR